MKHNKILIVDDEQDLVMNLEAALRKNGYEIYTASGGAQALKIAPKIKPDVVLLDIMMPGMDGYQVCSHLKENSETEKAGIILLTAKDMVSSMVEGLDTGADDYITKPFSYDELMARIRAMCRISEYREKLSAMVEFNNAMNVLEIDQLKDVLEKHLTDVFHVDLFSVFTYHDAAKELRLFAQNHPNAEEIRGMKVPLKKSPFMRTVVEGKKVLYVPEFSKSEYKKRQHRNKYSDGFALGVPLEVCSKVMGIPLEINGKVMGVLNLTGNAGGFFNKPDFTFLRLGAEYIASSISNALSHRKIQELALRDGLTELYNHRYFHERLKAEWERARRYGKTVSIILMDVDYFKKINDTFGHLSGDMVLRETARLLNKHVRVADVVARYGGEEFVIMLPETLKKEAARVAERIRKDIEKHKFKGEKDGIKFTISMGVEDSKPVHIKKCEDLVQYADDKLYKAKRNGRNRVVS
ncbi:MAG: diguanylate cyclase response regulator [bacterium]|nr:MAG: diguanylate cyclase response regulator [bacterium]